MTTKTVAPPAPAFPDDNDSHSQLQPRPMMDDGHLPNDDVPSLAQQ